MCHKCVFFIKLCEQNCHSLVNNSSVTIQCSTYAINIQIKEIHMIINFEDNKLNKFIFLKFSEILSLVSLFIIIT